MSVAAERSTTTSSDAPLAAFSRRHQGDIGSRLTGHGVHTARLPQPLQKT